jgi:hypothetical protein
VRDEGAGLGTSQRLRGLVVVVAVMAALTAGWPLANLAVSDNQPLAAGKALMIGPDTAQSARFAVGSGWSLRSAQSNPKQNYSLRYGGADLSVTYVALSGRPSAARLWSGLMDILRVSNSSARLGRPVPVTDSRGRTGITGPVTENGRSGTATILLAPAGNFAIEMIVLAPRSATAASLASASQVVRSIRFAASR